MVCGLSFSLLFWTVCAAGLETLSPCSGAFSSFATLAAKDARSMTLLLASEGTLLSLIVSGDSKSFNSSN